MENVSATEEKVGIFASGWRKLKGLFGKLRENVTNVAKNTKKLGKDDPRRITHSLKVGLALTLVSLLYYWKPLYNGFGVSGIWAVLTVVLIFEFTVGATLSKGLNRALATILAGGLGLGAHSLASFAGREGEPIVIAVFVFLLAAASTFSRFFPMIKARYDYGVLIFILTFSLVSVSGYRVEQLIEFSHHRVTTILLGGAACILISIFIFPVWAGENLHKSVASNIEKLASYLEGFGGEYFQWSEDGESHVKDVPKDEKSYLGGYRSVLNSKSNEESMANFARWEPRHGKFPFRHPWKQYLKIGSAARQCAYRIEALNGYINPNTQVPQQFKKPIEGPCTKMSSESGKALKLSASSIKKMKHPSSANLHVNNAKTAINELKIALASASNLQNSDLLSVIPAATVASILVEIVKCVENISESVHELSNLANFKGILEPTVSPEIIKHQGPILHRGTVAPVLNNDSDDVVIIKVDGINNVDFPEIEKISTKEKPGQVQEICVNI